MQDFTHRMRRALENPQKFSDHALRLSMLPFSLVYEGLTGLRSELYLSGTKTRNYAEIPVISVGNITAGGTGKTPFTALLLKKLKAMLLTSAVVSRGYGSREGVQDEEELLREKFPDTILIANPDRTAGVAESAGMGAKVAVLDDGFQHMRLRRDLDIVLIDATSPFGGRRVIPGGLLREPLSALRRADCLVLTRTDQVLPERLAEVKLELQRIVPEIPLVISAHQPVYLKCAEGSEFPLSAISGKKVSALSAIARPERFRQTLESLGAEVVCEQSFSDHYFYTEKDLKDISAEAQSSSCDYIITTAKDMVKLKRLSSLLEAGGGAAKLLSLEIEIAITEGEEILDQLIKKAIDR